jgi:uncharacterized protein (DUF1697 family)
MEHDFKTPDDVTEFESQMAKNAKSLHPNDKKKLEKAVKEKKQFTAALSMAIRYENAWKSVYSKLPKWRQNEIDNQLKSGRLSNKDWDTDFVQQVVVLAESDDS